MLGRYYGVLVWRSKQRSPADGLGIFVAESLPGLLLRKICAQHDADRCDACEENDECQVTSTSNLSDPGEDAANDEIQQRPENVHGWR